MQQRPAVVEQKLEKIIPFFNKDTFFEEAKAKLGDLTAQKDAIQLAVTAVESQIDALKGLAGEKRQTYLNPGL